nr:hypothetical protein [Tanacetum cinerariifolium]
MVRDTIFYEIPPGKTCKVKGKPVVLDPYQMVNSEMKLDFKKYETILSENAISLSGKKDHPNACLVYMLYCLTIQTPFNLAYYGKCNQKRLHGKTHRIMIDGKRPHPQTPSESSSSPSPTSNQEENDPVDNYTLDPVVYINHLSPITEGESPEFKKTKGMFKCFGRFLFNLEKKK